MADAQLLVRTLKITPPEGPVVLVVEVEIVHPGGTVEYHIPGQFVTALRGQLQRVEQEHPGLCGREGVLRDRVDWEGRVDPQKVSEN